jgi:hypothetical protein
MSQTIAFERTATFPSRADEMPEGRLRASLPDRGLSYSPRLLARDLRASMRKAFLNPRQEMRNGDGDRAVSQ